ncbi:MAG: 16S rRNA processing protein RimM [Bacteroidetes bacterium]|nr:MAG: 16S rRNA processing protein RimM [Bacteroidota bacterium]
MVRFEDCRHIGRIGKPHGHEGKLKLDLLPQLETDLQLEEPVFLLIDGKPVPFFMQECNEAANPPILHFEDITDLETAKLLTGLKVFAPKSAIEGLPAWYGDLDTYTVTDVNLGEIGPIKEIRESGLQELICIDYKGQEILIPYQDELVVDVDEKRKILKMDLPEGLLDLYLDEA